jgi:uncharacterized membrane protein YjdF
MSRTRTSVAVLCIAIVVFSAIVPAVAGHFFAILVPLWLVVPAVSVVIIRRKSLHCDEQSISLLSLALSRAPPAPLPLA